jgi:hypothetical protein
LLIYFCKKLNFWENQINGKNSIGNNNKQDIDLMKNTSNLNIFYNSNDDGNSIKADNDGKSINADNQGNLYFKNNLEEKFDINYS